MTPNERRRALKARLSAGSTMLIPGAYDALSAMLIEKAGFEAVYVGSYSTAASGVGSADVGIVGREEMVRSAQTVVNAVSVPVLADAEDGWADAANIWRTVRMFEDAGVAGIHIEDHAFGKHAAVTPRLDPVEEAAGRIAAAVAARRDPDFLIIGRTDAAWANHDEEDIVRRLTAYRAAGADVLMPAGIMPDILGRMRARIHGPVLVTDTVGTTFADERRGGADAVLYYGFTLYAAYSGVKAALEQLRKNESAERIEGIRDAIPEFESLFDYEGFVARHKRYGVRDDCDR